MIYMGLLMSESAISNGRLLIGKHESLNRRPIDDVDSRILRACRAVFKDALDVLYAYSCSISPIARTWIVLPSKDLPGEFQLRSFSSDASLVAGSRFFRRCTKGLDLRRPISPRAKTNSSKTVLASVIISIGLVGRLGSLSFEALDLDLSG